MDTIKLRPEYKKIENELIRNNIDHFHKDAPQNAFIQMNAHMIAQGLQLAQDALDEQND